MTERSRRTVALLVAVATTVFVIDLTSKLIVVRHMTPGDEVRAVGGLLKLTLTRNSGAAFSIGQGATALFAFVAIAVILIIARTARRLRSAGWATCLGLLLGGALGNLMDRLFRSPGPLRGHVVDWLELPHWPVFNLADSAIVVGGLLAVVLAARGIELEGRPDLPPLASAEPDPTAISPRG